MFDQPPTNKETAQKQLAKLRERKAAAERTARETARMLQEMKAPPEEEHPASATETEKEKPLEDVRGELEEKGFTVSWGYPNDIPRCRESLITLAKVLRKLDIKSAQDLGKRSFIIFYTTGELEFSYVQGKNDVRELHLPGNVSNEDLEKLIQFMQEQKGNASLMSGNLSTISEQEKVEPATEGEEEALASEQREKALVEKIAKVKSFEELYEVLREVGEISDGLFVHSAEELKIWIENARNSCINYINSGMEVNIKDRLIAIPKYAGLNDKVEELIRRELESKKSRQESRTKTPESDLFMPEILTGEGAEDLKASMRFFELQTGDKVIAGTDKGIDYKDRNEDRVVVCPNADFIAVIDGVGGEKKGELAAQILAEELSARPSAVELAVLKAKEKMTAQQVGEGGAVFISAKLYLGKDGKRQLLVAQAGDARLVVIKRNGHISFQSKDESHVQMLVDLGIPPDQALYHPDRNIITNRISSEKGKVKVYDPIEVEKDDLVLLMSDGISDNFTPEEIAQKVKEGMAQEELFVWLSDTSGERMKNYDQIAGSTEEEEQEKIEERKRVGVFSDGFRSAPKQDNRALAIIELKGGPVEKSGDKTEYEEELYDEETPAPAPQKPGFFRRNIRKIALFVAGLAGLGGAGYVAKNAGWLGDNKKTEVTEKAGSTTPKKSGESKASEAKPAETPPTPEISEEERLKKLERAGYRETIEDGKKVWIGTQTDPDGLRIKIYEDGYAGWYNSEGVSADRHRMLRVDAESFNKIYGSLGLKIKLDDLK